MIIFVNTWFSFSFICGDKATFDPVYEYLLLGREDDVLNISGHRISSSEIEVSVNSHDFVAEVAAVGHKHEVKGEVVIAFVVLKKQTCSLTSNELKTFVKSKYGSVMVPSHIYFLESLPKTRSGKIMRRLLKKIVSGQKNLGDTSTIENSSVLNDIVMKIQ